MIHGNSILLKSVLIAEAFAYRGFLFCWTVDNDIVIYNTQDLIAELSRIYGPIGEAVAYSAFCSRGIGATDSMKSAFNSMVHFEHQEPLLVHVQPMRTIYHSGFFGTLLDVNITYDRVYLATDVGLLSTSLDSLTVDGSPAWELLVGTMGPCRSTSSGMGAVAGSFGKGGLLVLINELRRDRREVKREEFDLVSARSTIRSGFVVNFRSDEQYQELPATFEREHEKGPRFLSSIPRSADLSEHLPAIRETEGFAHWDSSSRKMIDVSRPPRGESRSAIMADEYPPNDSDATRLGAAPTKPLSVSTTFYHDLILERESSVEVEFKDDRIAFPTGPCIRVRAFRNSWRYKRLIVGTSRTGVWLLSTHRSTD